MNDPIEPILHSNGHVSSQEEGGLGEVHSVPLMDDRRPNTKRADAAYGHIRINKTCEVSEDVVPPSDDDGGQGEGAREVGVEGVEDAITLDHILLMRTGILFLSRSVRHSNVPCVAFAEDIDESGSGWNVVPKNGKGQELVVSGKIITASVVDSHIRKKR
jgi:hypothetical protein